jgi:hypothetical protein
MRTLRDLLPALVGVAVFSFASQAWAVCDVDGETFYLHQNDETRHTARTDSKGCDLHFISAGKTTEFSAASIASQPKNGDLSQIAHLEFRYRPKAGFKGNDEFALRVCGRTPKGKAVRSYITPPQ